MDDVSRVEDVAIRISQLPEVLMEQRPRLIAAVLALVAGVIEMSGEGDGGSGILGALEVVASQGLSDSSDSTYYPEEEEPGAVDEDLAKKGLNSFGKVTLSTNLWNSVISTSLDVCYK